jgi:hypothetical protein
MRFCELCKLKNLTGPTQFLCEKRVEVNSGSFRDIVLEMMLGRAGDARHGGNVNHA